MARAQKLQLALPQDELTGLLTTRASLQARQAALAAEVEQAIAQRRKMLIDGGDAAAVADAERVCREIEGTALGLADALDEVERRITAAEARIEAARVSGEIEAVAGGLERSAAEIETATAGLAMAIDAVAKAHGLLARTIGGTASAQFDPHNGIASPNGIATALLLQGLVAAVPGLDVDAEMMPWSLYSMRRPIEAADPVGTAAEFGERLRETAGKVRTGEIGRDLPAHHDATPDFTPDRLEVEIFVLHPFRYLRKANLPQMVTAHRTHVPKPVAARAIEVGAASAVETAQWRAKHASAGSADATVPRFGWADCVDIEFDLAEWTEGEIERRRAAHFLEGSRQAA